MKKKIRYCGIAVEDLLLRIKSLTEDAVWIRMRNSELSLELREARRETERLRNELEIARKEKTKLEREMGERMRKIEEKEDRIRNREEELNRNFSRNNDDMSQQPVKRARQEPPSLSPSAAGRSEIGGRTGLEKGAGVATGNRAYHY